MQNSMRELQQIGTKMNSIGKSMSTYITLPILAAGGAAIKFASDYNESLNKVDVAFGPASDTVKKFAKTSLESFGLAEGSALDAAAAYGDMATSMGLPQSAAAKMSTSLVGLAGDLASFKNIGIDQANTALAGIFTGETESLKKLGIVMTEQNLQQFALSKGIKVQLKDMDQASKVNLRYAYIMANTTNAQGDFARTGGGAANQMRIFQESLKQIAQQFGAVILPIFTKAIVFVNGLLKSFSDLSDGTKTTIVVIAGIAAAIGPLMVGLGNLIGLVPRLIVQFEALQATIIANPYMAAAIGILAVGAAIYAWYQSSQKASNSVKELSQTQKTLNQLEENASSIYVDQRARVDELVNTAKSETATKKDKLDAIKKLNAISPEYLGNITLETINTESATKAINRYNEALLKGAKAKAAQEILVDLNKKVIQNEIDQAKAREEVNKQLEVNTKNQADNILKQNQQNDLYKKNTPLLESFAKTKQKQNNDEIASVQKVYNENKKYLTLLNDVVIGTDAITGANERQIKAGTIEFYKAQIDAIQKLQEEQVTTNAKWLKYQDNIDAIQKKIDALTNAKIKLPKPEIDMTDPVAPEAIILNLDDYERQIERYRELQRQFSNDTESGKATYKSFEEAINNTQLKINEIKGVEETVTKIDAVKSALEDYKNSVTETMTQSVASFSEGFANVVATWVQGGNLLAGVGNLFLTTLADMMVRVGKIAIETGIAISGIKKALLTLNPGVSIAAGIALIALGTLVKSQIAGSFADGGMVGGTSYSGDKLFARVNSGEMILNQKQQNNLSRMINPAVTSGDLFIQLMGGFEIEGTKLKLVLDRTDKMNSRKG